MGEDTDHLDIESLKHLVVPMSEVSSLPAKWVLPGLLVPGMNLITGPPKVFKSYSIMRMIAALLYKVPFSKEVKARLGGRSPTVASLSYEQPAGSIKRILEERILHGKVKKGNTVSWDYVHLRDPFLWKLDEPRDEEHDLVNFVRLWRPTVMVVDPLVYAHSLDENDPRIVDHIAPLAYMMAEWDGALVIVHHNRKAGAKDVDAANGDWNMVRGTSALFGMAAGALMLKKLPNGKTVNIATVFKEHPSGSINLNVE